MAADASISVLLTFYQEQGRAVHAFLCYEHTALEATLHAAQREVAQGRSTQLRADSKSMMTKLNSAIRPFAMRETDAIDTDAVEHALTHGSIAARSWVCLVTTGEEGRRKSQTTRSHKVRRSAILFAAARRIGHSKTSVEDNAFGLVLFGALSADGVKRKAFKTLAAATALTSYPQHLDKRTDQLNALGVEALATALYPGGRAEQIAEKGSYISPLVSIVRVEEHAAEEHAAEGDEEASVKEETEVDGRSICSSNVPALPFRALPVRCVNPNSAGAKSS